MKKFLNVIGAPEKMLKFFKTAPTENWDRVLISGILIKYGWCCNYSENIYLLTNDSWTQSEHKISMFMHDWPWNKAKFAEIMVFDFA